MPAAILHAGQPDAVAKISDVIQTSLGREVQLSADAFAATSLITLERTRHETIHGTPATGLLTEKPEQFRLVSGRTGCALVRVKTGEVLALPGVRCRVEVES